MQTRICLDTKTVRARRLPRKLVAFAEDGQVGVESTGVCGPVRAEAGDWHTAPTAQGLDANYLTAALTLLEREEGGHDIASCWKSIHSLFMLYPSAESDNRV